jgi:hypothetical protein
MPNYTPVELDYVVLGPGSVWVDSRSTFRAESLAKNSDPESERQAHFAQQLMRLSDHLGSRRIPIFINWPVVGRKRMDKGCIGHAIAAEFLLPLSDSEEGYVTHIEIAERP